MSGNRAPIPCANPRAKISVIPACDITVAIPTIAAMPMLDVMTCWIVPVTMRWMEPGLYKPARR